MHTLLLLDNIPRTGRFPFPLKILYCCNDFQPLPRESKYDSFEVCIRLQAESLTVTDIVDGETIVTPCPHVIFRRPDTIWETYDAGNRDVVSFAYAPEVAEKLKELDMLPDCNVKPFAMSEEIENLIAKIKKIKHNLSQTEAVDTLDWTCFCLLGLLRFQLQSGEKTPKERIRSIATWFHLHYNENINLDEVAKANGMSHACFFRTWKKYFDVSPTQYILDIKLDAAAELLRTTTLPISKIVQQVHFSSEYTFYTRFRRKYHATPDCYRNSGDTI